MGRIGIDRDTGANALVPRPTLAMPLLPMTCITANNNESAAKKRILGMALWALASPGVSALGMGRFIPSRPLVETLDYEVRKFLGVSSAGPNIAARSQHQARRQQPRPNAVPSPSDRAVLVAGGAPVNHRYTLCRGSVDERIHAPSFLINLE